MYIRNKFKEWNQNTFNHRHFSHLTYLRTFSIEEFKRVFNISSILVKRHPAGFLFFEIVRMEDWGLVYTKIIPENPVISLICDFNFNMFFLLHENGATPMSMTINSTRYHNDSQFLLAVELPRRFEPSPVVGGKLDLRPEFVEFREKLLHFWLVFRVVFLCVLDYHRDAF